MIALTISGKTEYLDEDKRDDAMQRYWQAKQSGDQTANLVKVEKMPLVLVKPDDDDDPEDPPPAATPSGVISPIAQARITQQETWLMKAGFSLPPPLFAPGTRVVELGDENFRIERQRVDKMPLFSLAMDRICDQIRHEARSDIEVGLRQCLMTDTGTLTVHGQELAIETGAFQQLAVLGGFGKGLAYLRELCEPELRAFNVNRQLEKTRNRKIVLRTRENIQGGRQVFAVVTPTYAVVDSDAVLANVHAALRDAHTEMRYDGMGVYATALWMPDEVVDLAAGDVFKVGVRVETDDTGRGRIRISGVAFRNLCLNLIIIGEGEVETVSAVHKGDPSRILSLVRDGVNKARDKISSFLEAWGYARTVKVDPMETFEQWVEEKKLQVRGDRDRDALVEILLSSWKKEPGDTLADCVNAVSRAAHETPTWGLDVREEFERQAAKLVLVPR